jgi:hypothetical protein
VGRPPIGTRAMTNAEHQARQSGEAWQMGRSRQCRPATTVAGAAGGQAGSRAGGKGGDAGTARSSAPPGGRDPRREGRHRAPPATPPPLATHGCGDSALAGGGQGELPGLPAGRLSALRGCLTGAISGPAGYASQPGASLAIPAMPRASGRPWHARGAQGTRAHGRMSRCLRKLRSSVAPPATPRFEPRAPGPLARRHPA